MFTPSPSPIDSKKLTDFIEKPSQNFDVTKPADKADLEKGVTNVISVISKNPELIMLIIIDPGRYFPTSNFLLDDLASKLEMANLKNKIELLFAHNSCFEFIMKECIYNSHDLERCIAVAPNYRNQLLKSISDDKVYFTRLLAADNNPQQTLSSLSNKYPDYSEIFTKRHQELSTLPTLKNKQNNG